MSGLVVDASAAMTLLTARRDREAVHAQLRRRILAGEPILVPSLFWIQVVEALSHEHGQPPTAVVEAVYELGRLGLETAEVGRPGVLAVIDAVGRGVTAAEAAYLVLAESAEAELLTASPLLAAVAGERATLVGTARHVRRPRRTDRSWVRWRGAVAYLRELRSAL